MSFCEVFLDELDKEASVLERPRKRGRPDEDPIGDEGEGSEKAGWEGDRCEETSELYD